MEIQWATKSDTGKVRSQNEDSVRAEPAAGLGVLCDGMGGHRAGEVASRLALETFLEVVRDRPTEQPIEQAPNAPLTVARLIRAAWEANDAVYAHAQSEEAFCGMGCTLVALLLDDSSASFVTVGDSRIYLLRRGRLHQISQDHTRLRMLEQMGIQLDPVEAKQIQGMLVRALGTQAAVDVDYGHGAAFAGDVWLLCSDGLTDELKDEEIQSILESAVDAEAAASECVGHAVEAGGRDNVSVTVARIVSGPAAAGSDEIPSPETCSPTVEPESGSDGGEGFLSRLSRRLLRSGEEDSQDGSP